MLHIGRSTTLAGLIVWVAACQGVRADPYQTVDQGFGRYVDRTDPLVWAMKAKSLARGPYEFWRGSRDVFYAWAKTQCRDWVADPRAFVPSHGDVHFGNIGAYPTAPFGSLSFGPVDFDDSAALPFQLDLLSIYISSRLVAEDKSIAFPEPVARDCLDTIVSAYTTALTSGKTPTELLAGDELVKEVSEDAGKKYKKEVDRYCESGRFRAKIVKNDKLMEVLRPADKFDRAAFGKALKELASTDPAIGVMFNYTSAGEFTGAIKDVALRTRLGSSGSQGLDKILVLMTEPLRGQTGDVLLYLKQQIPSAPERQKLAAAVSQTPGQRCVTMMSALNVPPALFSAAVELDGKSYWLTLKEPWSNELDWSLIQNSDDIVHYARITATTLGAAHGAQGRGAGLKPLLTTDLIATLRERGDAYAKYCGEQYELFVSDPRVKLLRAQADDVIRKLSESR